VNTLLQSVSLRQLEAAYTGSAGPGPEIRPPPGPVRNPRQPTPYGGPRTRREERAAAIPDKVTNSIIVVAGEAEYAVIRKIIESLDIRRPQVLIEVVILELSEGDGFNLGVELTTLDGARDDSNRGFGATRFGFSNLVDENGSPLLGPGIPRGQVPSPAQGSVIGIHRGKEWRIPAIVNLIGSDSVVNVMSLPRIVTNDNKEAKLKVTDNVPFATATSTVSAANQSFGGFKEAGIEITVTPHISEGDYLRLEFDQTVSQFTGTSQVVSTGDNVSGVLPPSRKRSELTSVLTIPDGKTVIIGGLTSRSRQKTVTKVPLLGDIPLLGELFRKTSMEWKRTNLYVFITPHIITGGDFDDLEAMSKAELAEAEELGGDMGEPDRHYKRAFREEREMEKLEEGRTRSLMEYRSPRAEEQE
jgi:general secretion pathway protein D